MKQSFFFLKEGATYHKKSEKYKIEYYPIYEDSFENEEKEVYFEQKGLRTHQIRNEGLIKKITIFGEIPIPHTFGLKKGIFDQTESSALSDLVNFSVQNSPFDISKADYPVPNNYLVLGGQTLKFYNEKKSFKKKEKFDVISFGSYIENGQNKNFVILFFRHFHKAYFVDLDNYYNLLHAEIV